MGKFFFRLFTGMHAKIIKLTRGRVLAKSTLVLTHKGAKSGKVRETPLMYFPDGDDYLIVASAGGAPHHPGWYHNLMANPETTIQVGRRQLQVRGREAGGDERNRIWAMVVAKDARYEDYQALTAREIPVVVLEPIKNV